MILSLVHRKQLGEIDMIKNKKVKEDYPIKSYESEDYNYIFNLNTGYFSRWGKTESDDPQFAPSPEILDIEITTKCNGGCDFCYKSNTPEGKNMSFETFEAILDKFDTGLTQIAFGADVDGTSNPDLFRMMYHAKKKGVIPNITLANIKDEMVDNLSNLCGAVAISRYEDKEICYNSVKKLTDAGMKQVNIHMLLSEETYDMAIETARHTITDSRLGKLNAIVFLSLKQKGRGEKYTPLSYEKFRRLISFCLSSNISFGMDSCSATKFLKVIKNTFYNNLEYLVEPCEATCFSSYINVNGEFSPCSFADDEKGIPVLKYNTFDEVWNHPKTLAFRTKLLDGDRACPIYTI